MTNKKNKIAYILFDDKTLCVCSKHSKKWLEGDTFERFGGKACEECINNKLEREVVNKRTMTNEEILKRAIEKAEKNGWDYEVPTLCLLRCNDENCNCIIKCQWPKDLFDKNTSHEDKLNAYSSYYQFIFSHNFARAFWGTEDAPNLFKSGVIQTDGKVYLNETYPMKIWEYHLQQMVLEEEPIRYLRIFL